MRTLLLSSALALALGATMVTDASAWWGRPRPELPWCAFYNAEGIEECLYYNVAQCRASVSGVGGFCYRNVRYIEPPPVRKPRAKRKSRR